MKRRGRISTLLLAVILTAGSMGLATPAAAEADAADEIFFYRDDGVFRYYDIKPDGSLGAPILQGNSYTAGWSSITAVDLDGDGQDEMFFYRDDGLFRYYDINPDGSLGAPILAGGDYTAGWRTITAVDMDGDGQDEMLFYRDDGLFRYYDIDADARLGSPILAGNAYTPGWTSITAIDMSRDQVHGERDELLFYRMDGLFRYYFIEASGQIGGPTTAGSNYTTGWTSIAGLDLDGGGAPEQMLFYRDDGLYRFYNTDREGIHGRAFRAGDDFTTGWTSITAVNLDGNVPAAPSTPPNPGDAFDCSDFSTWADAQAWYETYFPLYGDVANLDADDDGTVCETLPGAP